MATDAWGWAWGGPFTRWIRWGAAEQVTLPSFGPPFIDRQTPLLTTLGATNLLLTAIGLNNTISPDIELQTLIRSPRIDRSL
jgi:hypothetical protein